MPMTLTTENLCDVIGVELAVLDELLASDAFGKFAVLSASDQEFIQAHGSDPWVLEYHEHGQRFRVEDQVTLEQVRQAFRSYLTGGSEWRTAFNWNEMTLLGPSPHGCTTSRLDPRGQAGFGGVVNGGRYDHDVRRWTVGELRRAMADLPDDLTLRVEVAGGPSTLTREPWGNDQFVVIGAAVDDEDDFSTGDLVVRVDYSSGWYMGSEFSCDGGCGCHAAPSEPVPGDIVS